MFLSLLGLAGWVTMAYAPARVDNPMKGLVPYRGAGQGRFPHSMEFDYLAVSDVVVGRGKYDWGVLERMLEDVRSRGNQTIVRFYLEYPGKPSALPKYLIEDGLKVHRYLNTNTQPFPPTSVETPDYADPRLVSMLVDFVREFGRRYDGDARLAYVTAGLLGTWGEWHTYPRNDLHPPKGTQIAVMDAYASAFKRTPVLLRYPSGANDPMYASNCDRPTFGYHDDSFAWATLHTGSPSDSWFFESRLRAAGVEDRWKTRPIGGEIRPEAWGVVFDESGHPKEMQSFRSCVDATRVTWLMDSGMFREVAGEARRRRALEEVRRMGYEIGVTRWRHEGKVLEFELRNTGVAPFYADWPLQIGRLDDRGRLVEVISSPDKLASVMPGTGKVFKVNCARASGYLLRILNPMRGGKSVGFANEADSTLRPGWLTLSTPPVQN